VEDWKSMSSAARVNFATNKASFFTSSAATTLTKMALRTLNKGATQQKGNQALLMNINASKSLAEIMKTNLGPKGTMKM
jgi:hypothetical protein